MTQTAAISRPMLRYFGGKARLAPKIVRLMPKHRVYTEVFGGAASVLLHKQRAHSEIYNDLDGEVVNVFRVMQDPEKATQLTRLLELTPFAREEFDLAYKEGETDIEKARRTIIKSFMGFGSDSITRPLASAVGFNTRISTMRTGFRTFTRNSGTSAAHEWAHYPPHIERFCRRLQGVVIENRDAMVVIQKHDYPDALHYVDPPYPFSTRNEGKKANWHNYRHEMTDADHERMAEILHSLKGAVMVSSYASDLYTGLYSDWHSFDWTGGQFCHGSKKRTEILWMNGAAYAGTSQRRMEMELVT